MARKGKTTRFRNVVSWFGSRLWLIPACMSLAALGLAYLIAFSGLKSPVDSSAAWWIFSGDAATARGLLSTIASGMITMTSLVVSLTILVLSQAARQLGPRLIYNFVGDRSIQAVIGLFMATILYTLFILRSINDELGPQNVPRFAVTFAGIFTIACLFALLAYINKLAHSIVSDTVVRQVGDNLDAAIADCPCLPDRTEDSVDLDRESLELENRRCIGFEKGGYVQMIDYEALCRAAVRFDLILVVQVVPGEFVLPKGKYVEIRSREPVGNSVESEIHEAFVIGPERTSAQDLGYSVRQLVEIALRALSPSTNDPYTAIAVIDRLAAALENAWGRELSAKQYRDEKGRLRVVTSEGGHEPLIDVAFTPIRRAAEGKPGILLVLAERIRDLLQSAELPEQRAALKIQLQTLGRLTAEISEPEDQKKLEKIIAAGIRQTERI